MGAIFPLTVFTPAYLTHEHVELVVVVADIVVGELVKEDLADGQDLCNTHDHKRVIEKEGIYSARGPEETSAPESAAATG